MITEWERDFPHLGNFCVFLNVSNGATLVYVYKYGSCFFFLQWTVESVACFSSFLPSSRKLSLIPNLSRKRKKKRFFCRFPLCVGIPFPLVVARNRGRNRHGLVGSDLKKHKFPHCWRKLSFWFVSTRGIVLQSQICLRYVKVIIQLQSPTKKKTSL